MSACLKVHFTSDRKDWGTPRKLFEELDREFGFTLDVCALPHNAKCVRYFSPADDGLSQPWAGTCWMNPPYGDPEHPCKPKCRKKRCAKRGYHITEHVPGIVDWMRKAYEESCKGATVVCLVPARTDTRWWHAYAMKGDIRFLRGRLRFEGARSSAPFPSAIVVFWGMIATQPDVPDVTVTEVCGVDPAQIPLPQPRDILSLKNDQCFIIDGRYWYAPNWVEVQLTDITKNGATACYTRWNNPPLSVDLRQCATCARYYAVRIMTRPGRAWCKECERKRATELQRARRRAQQRLARQCAYCGRAFRGEHTSRQYCGTACRVAAHRQRQEKEHKR